MSKSGGKSKFEGLFEMRKPEDAGSRPVAEEVEQEIQQSEEPREIPFRTNLGASTSRRPGRPAVGKKSDKNMQQVTSYVRRSTYKNVRIELLRTSSEQDFSELVEELLAQWLRNKKH